MIDQDLLQACTDYGQLITGLTHEGVAVSGRRLLLTISGLESSCGKQREYARMEKGYAPGGAYYKASLDVRTQWKRWGCLAASSFGSFQIMFQVAREMGFDGHPIDLQQDTTSGLWASRLITERFIKRLKAATLVDVLDCYNSGYHKDQFVPAVYIKEGVESYGKLGNV